MSIILQKSHRKWTAEDLESFRNVKELGAEPVKFPPFTKDSHFWQRESLAICKKYVKIGQNMILGAGALRQGSHGCLRTG